MPVQRLARKPSERWFTGKTEKLLPNNFELYLKSESSSSMLLSSLPPGRLAVTARFRVPLAASAPSGDSAWQGLRWPGPASLISPCPGWAWLKRTVTGPASRWLSSRRSHGPVSSLTVPDSAQLAALRLAPDVPVSRRRLGLLEQLDQCPVTAHWHHRRGRPGRGGLRPSRRAPGPAEGLRLTRIMHCSSDCTTSTALRLRVSGSLAAA